jgi:formylglycine-generating enzyme required for sulfatase activity
MCKLFCTIVAVACLLAWPVTVVAQVNGAKPLAIAQKKVKVVKTIRDCSSCPTMVIIPAGNFSMGSAVSETGHNKDENPVHQVIIGTFLLSSTEITRGQFSEFVKETGYNTGDQCWTIEDGKYEERSANWGKISYAQNNSHPVVCISWNDATAYTEWLSHKTGKSYRLPTEAEWEYAARGKTRTARYWGESPDNACQYANVADKIAQKLIKPAATWQVHNCEDGFAYTAPVGSFKANAFGLHDMLGNVWEWVEDSYHDSYQGAPANGSAWAGNGKKHVIRGGSWYDAPRFVRAAERDKAISERRYDNFGFRIARNLP